MDEFCVEPFKLFIFMLFHSDFVPFLICPQSRDLGHYQWPDSWTGPASQLKSEPKQMLYFVKIWRILGTGG